MNISILQHYTKKQSQRVYETISRNKLQISYHEKTSNLQQQNTTSKRKYKDIEEEIKKAQNNIFCFKVESKNHYTKI